jgi:hypothetical protein
MRLNHIRNPFISFIMIVITLSTVLLLIIAFQYAYSLFYGAASVVGFILLLASASGIWFYQRLLARSGNTGVFGRSIRVGILLGLLWVVEIGINNILAPPLPLRDIIDNIFWAAIAFGILCLAGIETYRSGRFLRGVESGIWNGLVSGILACAMALAMIVFGQRFLLQDPLNIAEWAAAGAGSGAPSMAVYFAWQTFAGAFGHLTVLGIVMGGLLGVLGGGIGKLAYVLKRVIRRLV